MLKLFLSILLVCSTAYCTVVPRVKFGNIIRDLYGNSTADMKMMTSQWVVNGSIPNNTLTSQGEPYFVGIVAKQGSLQRQYLSLPDHNVLDFAANFRILDRNYAETTGIFRVKIDDVYFETFDIDTLYYWINYDEVSSDPGLSLNVILTNIPHSSNSITLEIFWEVESFNETIAFAIKDIVLNFRDSDFTEVNNCSLNYYNDNGECKPCNSSCQTCFGPSSTQCFPCQWGYTLVGNECIQCQANCSLCSGPNQGECLLCNSGYILDFDGTCIQDESCKTSPYVILDNSALDLSYSVRECAESCLSGEFKLLNSTCTSSCDLPLQPVTIDGALVCDSPCDASKYEYLFPDGNCSENCTYPSSDPYGNLFCNLSCLQYFYQNESCLPTCPAPYATGDYFGMKTCYNPCPDDQFLVPDGTCQSDCPNNYEARSESTPDGTRLFCSYPCTPNEYLYYDTFNRSCASTCRTDFLAETDDYNNKLCSFPCQHEHYLYENGSCLSTCPFPFTDTREDGHYFCRYPCSAGTYLRWNGSDWFCSACAPNDYLYENGSCAPTCRADFNVEIDALNNKLCSFPCQNLSYLFENGSCLSDCSFPLSIIWEDGYSFCRSLCPAETYLRSNGSDWFCSYPCASNEYQYEDGSCAPTCRAHFIVEIDVNNNKLCSFPCQHEHYLYDNGSCFSTCPFPFLSTIWEEGYNFCRSPCPPGTSLRSNGSHWFCYACAPNEYLYENGSCASTCRTDFRVEIDDHDNKLCSFPCQYKDHLYENGSCLSTCPFPFSALWEDGYNFCKSPCPPGTTLRWNESDWFCSDACAPNEYRYENGSCASTCRADFIVEIDDNDNKLCSFPCQNTSYLSASGACLSICPFPLSIIWEEGHGFCRSHCSPGTYLRPNGSCSDYCHYPWEPSIEGSINYCNPPCPAGQFIYYGTCKPTCDLPGKPYYAADVAYCYTTPIKNCTFYNASATWFGQDLYQNDCYNPFSQCDSFSFEYEDGRCELGCRPPRIPKINNYSAYCLKDPKDTSPDNTACWPWTYTYWNGSCSRYCNPPFKASRASQETLQYGYGFCEPQCPANMYTYDNLHCSPTCPAEFTAIEAEDYKYCKFPCYQAGYLYPDGSCNQYCPKNLVVSYNNNFDFKYCNITNQGSCAVYEDNGHIRTNCTNPDSTCGHGSFQHQYLNCTDTCDYPYKSLIANFSAYCFLDMNNPYAVYLEFYIRYDMSLKDFQSRGGVNQYIQQVATNLEVDPSDIIITNVTEGSTIIESKIALKLNSNDQDTVNLRMNEAQGLSDKYAAAVESNKLNIFGAGVLGYQRSVQVNVPPSGENPSGSQMQVSESSSGAFGAGIGVGVSILVVMTGGYLFYRRYRSRKCAKPLNPEVYKVRTNANQDMQETNDGTLAKINRVFDNEPNKSFDCNLGLDKDMHFDNNMIDIQKIVEAQDKEIKNELDPIPVDANLNGNNAKLDIVSMS